LERSGEEGHYKILEGREKKNGRERRSGLNPGRLSRAGKKEVKERERDERHLRLGARRWGRLEGVERQVCEIRPLRANETRTLSKNREVANE